jgi:hypothetical protein
MTDIADASRRAATPVAAVAVAAAKSDCAPPARVGDAAGAGDSSASLALRVASLGSELRRDGGGEIVTVLLVRLCLGLFLLLFLTLPLSTAATGSPSLAVSHRGALLPNGRLLASAAVSGPTGIFAGPTVPWSQLLLWPME